MSVKIFLPLQLFKKKDNCDIYGEIQINDNNAVSYFVVSCISSAAKGDACHQYRLLGQVQEAGACGIQRDVALSFTYDAETPNIYLENINIKPPNAKQANIFLYDATKMLQLHNTADTKPVTSVANDANEVEQLSDVQMLCNLLQKGQRDKKTRPGKGRQHTLATYLRGVLGTLVSHLFAFLLHFRPAANILRQTVLYEHYQMWRQYDGTSKRKLNILFDRILGLGMMFILLFVIPQPHEYFTQASLWIIENLHLLLGSLKGSPIGLKLNVHLNNFFLDCFVYHVDLWAMFLDLIQPLVRQLFVPIALLGAMGISFQLALLADLISVIGLHTHCFYIYAAVLYKVEIKGLQVLWKVMLGKRYNTLKKRVESHNYMSRQLFLATLFFTCLLFLFPTILVYYVVFTTLRLCVYTLTFGLQELRRYMLEFPLHLLLKWLWGNFYEKESLQLQFVPHVPSPLLGPESAKMGMSVFNIEVEASSLGRVFSRENARVLLQECATSDEQDATRPTLKTIFKRIVEGTF